MSGQPVGSGSDCPAQSSGGLHGDLVRRWAPYCGMRGRVQPICEARARRQPESARSREGLPPPERTHSSRQRSVPRRQPRVNPRASVNQRVREFESVAAGAVRAIVRVGLGQHACDSEPTAQPVARAWRERLWRRCLARSHGRALADLNPSTSASAQVETRPRTPRAVRVPTGESGRFWRREAAIGRGEPDGQRAVLTQAAHSWCHFAAATGEVERAFRSYGLWRWPEESIAFGDLSALAELCQFRELPLPVGSNLQPYDHPFKGSVSGVSEWYGFRVGPEGDALATWSNSEGAFHLRLLGRSSGHAVVVHETAITFKEPFRYAYGCVWIPEEPEHIILQAGDTYELGNAYDGDYATVDPALRPSRWVMWPSILQTAPR